MNWDEFLAANARQLQRETRYEYKFVDRVLRHVDGLRPADLYPQYEVDVGTGKGYVDFAVIDAARGIKLAIEVSGWDKTAQGTGPDRKQTERRLFRTNELARQGWRVLEFSNRQFMTGPVAVRHQIEETLEQLRTASRDQRSAAESPARGEEVAPAGATNKPSGRLLLAAGLSLAAVALLLFVLTSTGERTGIAPIGDGCPASHPVKGNVTADGERIYHVVGQRFYDATSPERCFVSPREAEDGGFRAAHV